MKKTIWIIVGVVVLLALWFLSSYNSLVTASESVDNKWAQVETQYQRRFDLIPNLVNAVKGAMSQEQTIFEELAAARSNYTGAQTVSEKAAAATQVESGLGRLLAIMENYPELKSIDTVQTLMAQLEGTENRISVERSRFNDEVKSYNVMIKRIPMNMVAGIFGYTEKSYFEVAAGVENAPAVDLNIN
ncbi:LemA family protein [Candidatus Falkowbacteria bacterium]|uniref:LemA family protein n=1 Tax=Candidatus Falkowbacteria bacterium CG10_big_fil_rev_8_21_14_0_10_37_18 TaxID=1974562 RepID=A0A2H0V9A5_9BACT|nr:LemA family protein [Candidatus Falkowbacteria bacterium]NCQ12655.1 LemA family protein [Candidatus Falkowbacteria bacterium]OIO06220.1 MAG: LemA family protein [Candidatus Falkowbacteria bacterium CG1_02_37_21]PIR95655.1 MAG: LemA family protein [Candidatus Falkowbacteria bacterium CG10_big_fil_rev_8_21_14_0_10_37_18]